MTNENNENINNFFTIYFIMDNDQEERRRNTGYSVENIGSDHEGVIETMMSNFASRLNRLNSLRRNNNQVESSVNDQLHRTFLSMLADSGNPPLRTENSARESSQDTDNDNPPYFVLFDLVVNGNTFSVEFERSHFNLIDTVNFFENLLSMRQSRLRMKKEQVNKLKRFRVTQKMLNDECTICMNKFKLREMARHLPCDHVFHSKCVDKWLIKHSCTCPVCRKEAVV
jgi:hypothetical protein